jgi:carboxyl-terminal processing protease
MRSRAILLAVIVSGTLYGPLRLSADEPSKTAEAPPAAGTETTPPDATAAPAAAEKNASKQLADEYELQKLFADTLDQVERNYVKDISRRELMEAAIHGVLSKLDQYSNYISPDDLGQFKTSVENQFGGIGIQIDIRRESIIVISPLVGSPAYRAGIQAGDRIVEIEGKSTADIRTTDEAAAKLKGEPGTTVNITTLRPSTRERKTLAIEREVVHMETVMGDRRKDTDDSWDFMLDHERKIGYIRITSFGRDTERDLARALDELKKLNLRGLVLDLRSNPGGLLTSAIGVADLFVTSGKIVSTEGRNTKSRSWDAEKDGTYEGFPMVVLVNRYSASASEIVSACLQDHKRAVVVGERTWGKGSVQNVIELEGGKSALKLTTAGYQRPSGKNIHRFPDAKESDEWGVLPDPGYEVKLDENEFYQQMNNRHDRDILLVNHHVPRDAAAAGKPAGSETQPPVAADAAKPAVQDDKKASPAATGEGNAAAGDEAAAAAQKPAFVDRQLQKAVDFLTGELAKAG